MDKLLKYIGIAAIIYVIYSYIKKNPGKVQKKVDEIDIPVGWDDEWLDDDDDERDYPSTRDDDDDDDDGNSLSREPADDIDNTDLSDFEPGTLST